ncbi:hypothetical protein EW026_g4545 [Hermanssonia centrifuga]|uniref:F-box domain-containing protein n=1 Tax=Hermanssonia centrifuga TaxID=98765 RepID=A0A4S4KGT2_9APHY|nr:hypothetical protein EW026_g4545 [Hermanssonia centrifuga]
MQVTGMTAILPQHLSDAATHLCSLLSRITHDGKKFRSFAPSPDVASLEKMEEQIITALSHVRTIINSQSSFMCRMPPEIIARIMEQVPPPPHPNFIPIHAHPRLRFRKGETPRSWMRATQVCRYWRAVALASPSLWTEMDFMSPDGRRSIPNIIKVFARRSADLPLNLHLWSTEVNVSYSRLNPILCRLRGFHMHRSNSHVLEQLNLPAPLLENLTLSPCETSMSLRGGAAALSYILPKIFADVTPSLRKLTINYFNSWPGNDFHGLTHLCLQGQKARISDAAVQDISGFLDFLSQSPMMEELILQNSEPFGNASNFATNIMSRQLVKLLALRVLIFEGCDPTVFIPLLCHLSTSPTTTVSIKHDDCRPIVDTLIDSHTLALQSIHFSLNVRCIEIEILDESIKIIGYGGEMSLRLVMPYANRRGFPAGLPHVASLLRLLSLSHTQELVVSFQQGRPCAWHKSSAEWRTLYSSIPSITKYVFHFPHPYESSRTPIPLQCLIPDPTPILPGLSELEIHYHNHTGALGIDTRLRAMLREITAARADHGCPIERISLQLIMPTGNIVRGGGGSLEDDIWALQQTMDYATVQFANPYLSEIREKERNKVDEISSAVYY